jgi:transposase
LNKEISIKDMVKVCPFPERSLKYWLANFRKHGMEGLENKSTRPKSNPNETPIRIKERIIELRKNNKDCAKKLAWHLEDEGIKINKRTVGKIIKKEGLTRKYRTKKVKYHYVRIMPKRGELVEIDVKYVPNRIKKLRYYQFMAIDVASRWRHLQVYNDLSNYSAIRFLQEVMKIAPFKIIAVKTDNASKIYFNTKREKLNKN